MYYVYFLKSLKDGKHYVGLTANLQERLNHHNKGRVRSTKSRRPFELIYHENFPTRVEAREREKYFKSYEGSAEKLTIIENL